MVELPDDAIEALIEDVARQRCWSVQGVTGGPLYDSLPEWRKAEYRRAVEQTVKLVAARVRAEALGASADVSVDAVRDAAAALARWCDDPAGSPTVLGSILAPLVPVVRAEADQQRSARIGCSEETALMRARLKSRAASSGVFGEGPEMVDAFERAVRAEAVADERQRLAAVRVLAEAARAAVPHAPYTGVSWRRLFEVLDAPAAGSGPVATPEVHDAGCELVYGQERCACQRRADVDFSHSSPGPVAAPRYCEHGRGIAHDVGRADGSVSPAWIRCPGPVATPTEPDQDMLDDVDRLRSMWRESPGTRTYVEDRYPGLAHAIERAVMHEAASPVPAEQPEER